MDSLSNVVNTVIAYMDHQSSLSRHDDVPPCIPPSEDESSKDSLSDRDRLLDHSNFDPTENYLTVPPMRARRNDAKEGFRIL